MENNHAYNRANFFPFMEKKQLNPPYVQVALDVPDWEVQKKVLSALPKSDKLILEAGTPLIKRYGIEIVSKIKEFFPNNIVLADLKTLDVGAIEVNFTHDAGAHAAVVSGLANKLSIDKFLAECDKLGVIGVMDMMELSDPMDKIKSLEQKPDILIFHRGIDTESGETNPKKKWKLIPQIKDYFSPEHNALLSVAGGVNPKSGKEALEMGADILIVGRFITGAENVEKAANEMLNIL